MLPRSTSHSIVASEGISPVNVTGIDSDGASSHFNGIYIVISDVDIEGVHVVRKKLIVKIEI